MKKSTKRWLSLTLTLVMLLGMVPAFGVAAKADDSSDRETPLTLEAKTAGAAVTVTNPSDGMQYSINDGDKLDVTGGEAITLSSIGDYVQFYSNSTNGTTNIKVTSGECYIYGNVMSLVSSEEFSTADTVGSSAFLSLFAENTSLFNHDTKKIVLPATTLSSYCYEKMFQNCTSLTEAPELPATTLATYCYRYMFMGCSKLEKAPELPATTLANQCYLYMFSGCTSLTEAPELPATTLKRNCYSYMFKNCTSLEEAPELPAETLANYCYGNMFQGCTSLTQAPELPAEALANNCYEYMFENCTSLEKAPELPATTLAEVCYYRMFQNCTSLEEAPELPATALVTRCYCSMFEGCTKLTKAPKLPAASLSSQCYYKMFSGCSLLNTVTCLATTTDKGSTTTKWLDGVAFTGTLIKAPDATFWKDGVDGIPNGWTAIPYVAATGVSLNKDTTTLAVGDIETLTATVSPDDAMDNSVTWTSSDETVVTVVDGVVTAVRAGTATITVTTNDGGYTAPCTVTVIPTHTVTWKNEDGTLLETDENVPEGETPEYNGETPTKEGNDQYTYTFAGWSPEVTAVTGDAIYTATYNSEAIIHTYTVTFVDEDGTEIETQNVEAGGTATKPADPTKNGYTFKGWQKDGVDYDFTAEVTENITLTAVWAKSYNVTIIKNGETVSESTCEEKERVELKAEGTGAWYVNGVKRSIKSRYAIYVLENTIAEWKTEETQEQAAIANIAISQRTPNGAKVTVKVTATWSLPSGAKVTEAGTSKMYIDTSVADPTSEELYAFGSHKASTLKTVNGTFCYSINMGTVSAAQKLCLMTYVTYTLDGQSKTVLSEVRTSAN